MGRKEGSVSDASKDLRERLLSKYGQCISRNGVPDEQATMEYSERRRAREQQRCDLYWALRSRVLTDQEMQQVEEYDYRLTIGDNPYNELEKRREFNDALLAQFKLHLAFERAQKV